MRFGRRVGMAVVCLLWAGMVIGVSVAETAKFHAPTLSRPAAFDVGRTVFHASQTLQFLPLAIALVLAAVGRVSGRAWALLALAGVTLVVQTEFLFPALDARAQTLIAGGVPVGHSPHAAYAVLEVLKVLSLLAAAVLVLGTSAPATDG